MWPLVYNHERSRKGMHKTNRTHSQSYIRKPSGRAVSLSSAPELEDTTNQSIKRQIYVQLNTRLHINALKKTPNEHAQTQQ